MKTIRLSGHARIQLAYRGVNEDEIINAIGTAEWTRSKEGRSECRKDFSFNSVWNGKQYSTKQVRPIFSEGENEIVVITVYSYFF
ncbi:DUF4258 domain-containing protein [candidate division TA06 bacterium]|uniref:DUF4258 domain-containing protein n=1 Tax=candidate division TA06 bacterium TaxID=2250710 RepID=A0A933MJN6_UNCT6|nr:DUF4258 domain-containing protein [candidate division TA06 bacterium]